MKIAILSNEYPPHVYGGAGVHVEYLTRELAELHPENDQINVYCFGDQDIRKPGLRVEGFEVPFSPPFQDPKHKKFMETIARNVLMTGSIKDADVIHCHTWYSHLAGTLVKQLVNAPLLLSTHSLEPHRPWKAEQLGSAYRASSWIERTAYENADGVIAVSKSMKEDVEKLYGVSPEKIRVIHNGIDLNQYRPLPNKALLRKYDINPDQPFILFVGRITRQKGIIHLVNAVKHFREGIQVVLCAGAPDTGEIGREMENRVEQARRDSQNSIIWIPKVLPKEDVISLYTHASLFVCPSVYEPFGIINLEAMACETPVVGTQTGGIPEIVIPDETGLLVPLDSPGSGDFDPRDPELFARDLAEAVNRLMNSPGTLKRMGIKSRRRVEECFSWNSIARQTFHFYEEVIERYKSRRI